MILAVVVAFGLRFIGIWYGLPSLYNSDEPFNVINALGFGAQKTLEPIYYVYPTCYSYFLFAIYGLYFLVGKLCGMFGSALDFGASYFLNPTGLFMVGRFTSVLLGTATIGIVYKLGQRFFSKAVGVMAALVLALSFIHADNSHWVILEPAVALLSAAALYLILKFSESPSVRLNLWASLVAGLVISTKYNAGFICVPLWLAIILAYKKPDSTLHGERSRTIKEGNSIPSEVESGSGIKIFRRLGLSVLFAGGGFLLGTPYWIFSFSKFWHDLKYTFAHVETGMAGHVSSTPLIWPLWELVYHDWSVGFLLVSGLIFSLFQRQRPEVLLLSFALPTLLLVGTWTRTGVHYLLPIFPALAVLAARFLQAIAGQLRNHRVLVLGMAMLLIPPLIKIAFYDFRLTQKDSRALAEDWVEANIPDGSVIGYENYVYGPNLFDPKRFLKDEAAGKLLPLEIKEKLLMERNRRISYNLVNFRKDFAPRLDHRENEPLLSNPYFRQLLQLRLPKLAELQKAGVQYLIASSDNYERYFKGFPPQKGTPLWISYQNSRQFYQAMFESEALVLLNEFKPSFGNLGPTIRIYQFKTNDHDRE